MTLLMANTLAALKSFEGKKPPTFEEV